MPRTPRQMHGRRVFAAAAAAGLLVSLFAPWYRETVVAHGLTGLRTLTLTRSGWQAFSITELLIAIAAALTLVVVIAMPADDPDPDAVNGLRLSGVLVTVLGAIAFVVVLTRLTTAPGTTRHALAETMVAIRWGIFLALACSAALFGAGLRLIRVQGRPAGAPRAERSPRNQRTSRAERTPRAQRTPGTERTPRARRAPSTERTRQERAARADGRAPAAAAPSRRPERSRPTRRAERPLWDEQASTWLNLPE